MRWGGWIVLAATILIVACGVLTCAMRRTLVSRKARKRRIAENAEMSGENYYNRQNAAAATIALAAESKDGQPITTMEIKDGSSGSLRTLTRGSDDDRTPLNTRYNTDVPNVPAIPPESRLASSTAPVRTTNASEPTIPAFALGDTSATSSSLSSTSRQPAAPRNPQPYNYRSPPPTMGPPARGGYYGGSRGGYGDHGAYRGGGRGGRGGRGGFYGGPPPPNGRLGVFPPPPMRGGPSARGPRRGGPPNFSAPRGSGDAVPYFSSVQRQSPLSMPEPEYSSPAVSSMPSSTIDESTIGQAIEMTPQMKRSMEPHALSVNDRAASPSSLYSQTR